MRWCKNSRVDYYKEWDAHRLENVNGWSQMERGNNVFAFMFAQTLIDMYKPPFSGIFQALPSSNLVVASEESQKRGSFFAVKLRVFEDIRNNY